MKNKPNLQNIDRSESGLLQIDNVTLGFLETTSISDGEMTLTLDPRYIAPKDVLSTWNDWQEVKNNTFLLHPTEDGLEAIYFDDSDPIQERNFVNNLSNTSHWNAELKRYLKAYRFILNLLLCSGEIEIFDQLSKAEIAFDILNTSIGQSSIWLEYYLLNDTTLLEKLNLDPPEDTEYKPGKVEAKQYMYICELFREAQNSEKMLSKKRYLCNWLLTYSSPAQIWFGLQVHHMKGEWIKKNTPGAVESKDTAFKNEQETLETIEEKLLSSEEEKSEKTCLKLIKDENAEDLTFDLAFEFTMIIFQELYESDSYPEFIEARRAKNNYTRKGGKPGGTGIQVLKTDKKGNLSMGNHKIESYNSKTNEITYLNKSTNNKKKLN